MSRKIVLLMGFFLFTALTGHGNAQLEQFQFGLQLGTGARAIGMGGAFTSIGGDYTASFWNPAALADIRRVEILGSLSHLIRQNTSQMNLLNREDNLSFTKLNNLGLAFPVPTVRGSLVFSFGYNRISSLDSNFDFRWFNSTPDDSVNQAWKDLEEGSLNAWIVSGAVDVAPNTSVGLSVNIWTGNDDLLSTFREVDIINLYDFNKFTLEQNVNSDIKGWNVKLGALYRLGEIMRFGATIATPTTFQVRENWSLLEELVFDDDSVEVSQDEGFFEYKIRTPFSFTGGASLHLLNLVISGDIEYNDWTQARFVTEPPIENLSKNEANRIIKDKFRPTARIRLGAEFTLPLTGFSFRAGYMRDPSIFKDALPEEDKQFYTAGLGFLLNKQMKLDVALVHGFWKRFNSSLPETDDITHLIEDIKVNKIFVSLAFRF